MKTKIESGISISPYIENEKRLINGKVVYVTYHTIDWKKNFQNSFSKQDKGYAH